VVWSLLLFRPLLPYLRQASRATAHQPDRRLHHLRHRGLVGVLIAAGVVAGSVALVGFGVDSGIEVTASVAYRFFLSTKVQRCERDVLPPRRWLLPAALITYT
jgi:hypothetical protein